MPEEIVLWPLEEMFRRRVIAFLVDQELLPRDRAEMLLSWQHSGFSLHRSRRVGLRSAKTSSRLPATSCATRSRRRRCTSSRVPAVSSTAHA